MDELRKEEAKNIKRQANLRRKTLKVLGYAGFDKIKDEKLVEIIKTPNALKKATDKVKVDGIETIYLRSLQREGITLPTNVRKSVKRKTNKQNKRKAKNNEMKQIYKEYNEYPKPFKDSSKLGVVGLVDLVNKVKRKLWEKTDALIHTHIDVVTQKGVSYTWGQKISNPMVTRIENVFDSLEGHQILWLERMNANGNYAADAMQYDSSGDGVATRFLHTLYRTLKAASEIDETGTHKIYGNMTVEDLKESFNKIEE